MLTLSVFFHLASLLATLVFVAFFLKSQKYRALARLCVQELEGRVTICDRQRLIGFLGDFLAVEVFGVDSWNQVGFGRVDPSALTLLHLSHRIVAFRCKMESNPKAGFLLQVQLVEAGVAATKIDDNLRVRLDRALGPAVVVELV